MSYRVVLVGKDVPIFGGQHPFEQYHYLALARSVYDVLQSLDGSDDLLVFDKSAHVDNKILLALPLLQRSEAEIIFLGDCSETSIAPRFMRTDSDGFNLIKVYQPCCMSALYLKGSLVDRLRRLPSQDAIMENLQQGLWYKHLQGARIFPPLVHCSPAVPHKTTVINFKHLTQNYRPHQYLILALVAAAIIIFLICLVFIFRHRPQYQPEM